MMRCAVIGARAWGTAIADLHGRNGHEVALWAFESDVVEMVNARHANPRFLPGAVLSPRVCAHAGLERALDDAALVLLAAPSHVLRRLVQRSIRAIGAGVTLVVASKGIERGTLALMTQIVEEEAPHRPVVALSGPSFAA
jgi:glycerol-3-phosphate dehydrogenase (NAD(P)+)